MEDMFLFSHKGDVPSCMSVFEGCIVTDNHLEHILEKKIM